MKRTIFVLHFPTEFAATIHVVSRSNFSLSLGLVFLFYTRKKETKYLWGYAIQIISPKLFYFFL